jgi:tetratricopeptide (TPR) repeat protein
MQNNSERCGSIWLMHMRVNLTINLRRMRSRMHWVLHTTTANELYANALDGIAITYTATGRLNIAEKCLRQALKLEDTQRGSAAEAETHVNLATVLVLKHRYEEAVKELSAALRFLETQADSDVAELIVVYGARSRSAA